MKYLLILFSAFTFGQASNQMVTFTAAQSLGFSLNAGQSAVTSNQCMTKNDALTKYNLSSSAMSSYATNQLVPKSVWVNAVPIGFAFSNVSGSPLSYVCTLPINATFYSYSSILAVNSVMYLDSSMTTFLNGGNLYLHYGSLGVKVNNVGVITEILNCP